MLYLMTFFWEFGPAGLFIALAASPLGGIVAYAVSRHYFKVFDRKVGLTIGISIWIVAHGLPVPLYMIGLAPEKGSALLVWFVAAFQGIAAFGSGQIYVGVGTMIADITDEHELQTGNRQEGIFFGAFLFLNKVAVALGLFASGLALDILQWPTGESVRSAADIAAETIRSLGLVWGPVASLVAVPALFLISRYSLSRERHAEIIKQIERQRRTAFDYQAEQHRSPEKEGIPI